MIRLETLYVDYQLSNTITIIVIIITIITIITIIIFVTGIIAVVVPNVIVIKLADNYYYDHHYY